MRPDDLRGLRKALRAAVRELDGVGPLSVARNADLFDLYRGEHHMGTFDVAGSVKAVSRLIDEAAARAKRALVL